MRRCADGVCDASEGGQFGRVGENVKLLIAPHQKFSVVIAFRKGIAACFPGGVWKIMNQFRREPSHDQTHL